MPKWEYAYDALTACDFKARGDEGWELVQIADKTAFFKRPAVPAPPAVVEPVAQPEAAAEAEPDVPAPRHVGRPRA